MRRLVCVFALVILCWAASCGGSGLSSRDSSERKDSSDTIVPSSDAGSGRQVDGSMGTDGGTEADGSMGTDGGMGTDGRLDTAGDGDGVILDTGNLRTDASPADTSDSAVDGCQAAGIEVGTTPNDGGGSATEGGAVDATADTGIDAAASACNAPTCYADLMKDCQPADTCIEQSNGDNTNQCYANGVKVITMIDATALTMSTTVKNGTRTCYEIDFDLASALRGAPVVGHIKDGSGNTVADLSDDASGGSVVTCTGGQPVLLNDACDPGSNGSRSTSCDPGDCGP